MSNSSQPNKQLIGKEVEHEYSHYKGAAMTQIDEPNLDKELDEMIKRDAIALCCNKCDGGGYDYDNTKDCDNCNGTGLTEWQNEYLINQIKALISYQVREELTNLKIARLNLGTITTDHADGYQMAIDDMNRHIDNRIKELEESK